MAAPDQLLKRDALIEHWREKLTEARNRYEKAKADLREIECLAKDLPQPDGSQAYRNALRAENIAGREFSVAVKRFTDLVLGKV